MLDPRENPAGVGKVSLRYTLTDADEAYDTAKKLRSTLGDAVDVGGPSPYSYGDQTVHVLLKQGTVVTARPTRSGRLIVKIEVDNAFVETAVGSPGFATAIKYGKGATATDAPLVRLRVCWPRPGEPAVCAESTDGRTRTVPELVLRF